MYPRRRNVAAQVAEELKTVIIIRYPSYGGTQEEKKKEKEEEKYLRLLSRPYVTSWLRSLQDSVARAPVTVH